MSALGDVEEINESMAKVFQEAQGSLSGHRRLVVILTNIQQKAIAKGYEEAFSYKLTKLINKILPLKKGEASGDRIIKFCSVFIANLFKIQGDSEDDDVTRVAHYLLNHLLRGVEAKDRNVRYRIIQLIAYLVNFIGDIDGQLFTLLVHSLKKRLEDKEQTVRLQAVVALSRFQHLEDETGNSHYFTKLLIGVMQKDESPEVRRAAFLNLVKTADTLEFFVERARDVNSINRRIIYSRVLKEYGDFRGMNPQCVSTLIKCGMNDRDPNVKNAAIKLFNNYWFESVDKDFIQFLENLQLRTGDDSVEKLLNQLLQMNLDIVKGFRFDKFYWKELLVAKSFLLRNLFEFLTSGGYYNLLDDMFVDLLELSDILQKYMRLRVTRLLANKQLIDTYNEYRSTLLSKREDRLKLRTEIEAVSKQMNHVQRDGDEDQTAVLERLNTRLEDLTQKYQEVSHEYKMYVEGNKALNEEYSDFDEEYGELEFIIENILRISKDYDYANEPGRRAMLQIVRNHLTGDELSDKLIEISLKVLRAMSVSERDFISMITEIITDIRDSVLDENDETFHSAISGFPSDSSDEDEDEDKDEDEGDGENPDYTNNLNRIDNVFDDQNFNKSYSKGQTPNKRRRLQPKPIPHNIVKQCLFITQHLLELINDPIADNYSLESILHSLVFQAVRLDDYSTTNKLGLRCLGLFMLLDKDLAAEKLYFFGRILTLTRSDEESKILAAKIIIDVLSTHGLSVLDIEKDMDGSHNETDLSHTRYVDSFSINKLFIKALNEFEIPSLQSVTAEGLCKLYLAERLEKFGDNLFESLEEKERVFEDLFEALILAYFDAKNYYNNQLRQVLAFCIPVYAFSHAKHQTKISKLSGDIIYKFSRRLKQYEETHQDEESTKIFNSIPATSVIQHLIHWCDPNNLVKKEDLDTTMIESPIWQLTTLLQAIEQETPKSVKKTIINNLGKIQITENLSARLLKSLCSAIEDTISVIQETEDLEFKMDSLTLRNFEKFYHHVKETYSLAVTREENDEEKRGEGLGDEELSDVKEEEMLNEDEEDQEKEGNESNDSNEENGNGDRNEQHESEDSSESETEAGADMEVDEELENIDKLLEAEDKVDYNI